MGTSDSKEAKEYFSDMRRHKITFKYSGSDDDHAIKLAFSKKMVEQRKDWLTNSLEERKRRRELGLPEVYLYESNTRSVSYKDFVNKELILFSNMDNERSIPSIMDGLKPGQRKVIFTCFLRNDKKEVKVAQLAGSVGEKSAYHHGEASLMSTIINLAQNFVGSNNINLLQPNGQFGTRIQGGKDSASPRYIFTKLSPLARKIYPAPDDPLLTNLYDDNLKIEPEYYVPILPMVLVNGAEGIGTGWSTKIPNYNPREIVDNIRRMLRGEPPETMKPWFKGFRGTITQIDTQRFIINGEVGLLDEKSFEITELPVRTWTQTYKESVLEPFVHGTEKTPSFINDYRDYHTDTTVRYIINLSENNLNKAITDGIHKTFKLQSSMSTTSMVLFDHNGCIKKYETPEEILEEFFPVRLEHYVKRKAYYEGKLEAEALKLENMARFIMEKNDHKIRIENVRKKDFVRTLIERRYNSDPVKAWIKKNASDDEEPDERSDEEEEIDLNEDSKDFNKRYDFNYLFDMSMRSMLREKVEELLKQRDKKQEELESLKRKSPEELWEIDLKEFIQELDRVEDEERKEATTSRPVNAKQPKPSSNKGRGGGKSGKMSLDSLPSEYAERVDPKIEIESYRKAEKANKKANDKKKKNGDNTPEKVDSDDDIGRPLSERIGISPQIIDEKKAKAKTVKPSVASSLSDEFKEKSKSKKSIKEKKSESPKKKGEKGKKKKNPWSDTESEEEEDYDFHEDSDEEPQEYIPSNTSTRVVKPTKKPKEESVIEKDDLVSFNTTNNNEEVGTRKKGTFYDSDDDLFSSPPAKKVEVSNKRTSEELFDAIIIKNDQNGDNESKNGDNDSKNGDNESKNGFTNDDNHSDDNSDNDSQVKRKLDTIFENKPTKASKKAFDSDSDFDTIEDEPKPKPKLKATKASKKAFDLDNDFGKPIPKKNAKPKKKKTLSDSEEEDKPKKKKVFFFTLVLNRNNFIIFQTKKSKDVLELDGFEIPPELREKSGRVRQPVKYNFGEDSSNDSN